MASNDVQDVRIESLESRIDKHDVLFEKMTSAQTEMMISIAKLHSSIKVLLLFVAAGMGLDFTGLV